ncbi:MAG: TlpA family protein disulfide reductase [Prevotella sp.]|nr:TlpA family protein disulfide reductase [Prevotella sp.]MDY4038393.1 TlpA disulfide reductase family protein [Prevotella sp.]
MKRLFYSLSLALLAIGASAQTDQFAYVQGQAEGDDLPAEIQLLRADDGRPAAFATTSLSPSGRFGFAIEPAAEEPFYYLSDGRNYFRIALRPASTVRVAWNGDGFRLIEPLSEANRLLRQWNDLTRPLRSHGKGDAYAAFFHRFDAVSERARQFLDSLNRNGSPAAARMEDIVRLDLLNGFIAYISKHQQSYDSEETGSAYFQRIMKTFPETTPSLLSQPYGCELMQSYFSYKQTYIYRQQAFPMDRQIAELQHPDLRTAYLLANIPTDDFAKYCEYEDHYLPMLPDGKARSRMRNNPFRPRGGMLRGQKAPNLIFEDIDGRLHSMSALRGKWIYVDVWATWCVPCKAEIPSLKALEAKHRNDNIAFVSISIDKNRKIWEQFVKDRQLGGLQLWAGDWTEFPAEMELGSVPRFLLIDPHGNWYDSNAPRPSAKEIGQILEQLLH